jgi:hypothetical protein
LLDRQHFPEIEDCLLPVRVFGVGTGREADGLVAGSEVDIEPCDQGVYEVIAAAVERERRGKGEVCSCAGVEVEGENRGRVGNYGFDFNGVDERFGESCMLERGVVEAVNIVPDCNLLLMPCKEVGRK